MADGSSSGPPAPEPKRYPGVTRHRDDVPEGPGEPRPPDVSQGRGKGKGEAPKGDTGYGSPRPAAEAKSVGKGKAQSDQGSEGHGPSRPAAGRGKGKTVESKGAVKGKPGKGRGSTPPKTGKGKGVSSGEQPRRRSASSLEYSRRRAGKRQREAGQYFRWSKAAPDAPPAKAMPPSPPPPRRRQEPESSSYSDESQEEGQGVRLRSRTPPDRRVPAEPSAPPKARGTAVKSKAKIVLPQEEEGRSESSSSSPEPARGSRPEAEEQASEARPEALPGQGEDPPQDDVDRGSPSPYVKEESDDSCYEPIRLRPAPSQEEAQRCLPFPDLGVSMLFRIQLKDAKKRPCSARYLMAASVEYSTKATATGAGTMVKTDLLVVGLGGSRIVVRSPSNPTLVWKISKEEQETERKLFRLMGRWTPGRVRALGAHRVQEVGPQGSVFYASVLEMEMCAECPRFCTQTAFELLLTIVHTAKFVLVRDVGRKNLGSIPSGGERMGEPGRNLLLLLDGNYWEPYGRARPHWPGRQKAQGLWSSVSYFTPELLEPFQAMTQRYSGDLESLFLAGHKLMEEMLPEEEFSEACENLLETQVLGRSPDGQLGQWILRDAVVHSLESGHSWTLVPLEGPNEVKAQGQIQC